VKVLPEFLGSTYQKIREHIQALPPTMPYRRAGAACDDAVSQAMMPVIMRSLGQSE